jgi:hypothetical protein
VISLNAVEVFWIAINLLAAGMTTVALIEARADWAALRKFNGSARGIVARGTVRREVFRLCSQIALLAVAIPSVFSDRDIVLTPPLLALMSVPVWILLNTLSDRQMRYRLTHKLEEEIQKERDLSLLRMEDRLNARADQRAGIAGSRSADLQETADDTNVRVQDIQGRTS